MKYHRGLFLPTGEYDPRREILSCTVAELLALAAKQAGVRLEQAGSGEGETAPESFWQSSMPSASLICVSEKPRNLRVRMR